MENPMKTQKILTVILVLQGLILMDQWLGRSVSIARGQIPDQGAQLNQIIDEMKQSNEKLDHLTGLLESGKLQVELVKPDDTQKQ
jgi:hypothetical protein